ncbi:response regulator transcription factor [Streptomyces sp. NPDC056704]|uniref:response regulator transcription factor n=1 Tax=Streptomyces sp. NPDC056704 TaxID=3345917 RepID=UPI0036B8F8E9
MTPHQLTALNLASTGHTHKEIARELGIDEKSIGKLMTEIFRKLGAKSMPHAVLLACRAGLLDGKPQRHGDHAGFAAHRYRGEEPCDDCWAGERAYRAEQRQRRRQEAADGLQVLPRPPVQAREAREGPQAPASRTNSPTTATAKQHPPERQRDAHPVESKESAA